MSKTELVFPLPIKAVVIDLDGTLLHTAPDLAEASNRMMAELGMPPVAEETVKGYIGNGVAQLIKRVLTGTMYGEPAPELYVRARKIYDRHYGEVYSLYSHPFPDVIEGLEAFKKAGPVLLEPIMKVEVTTPDEYQGDLLGDINRRRGVINGIEAKGGQTILNAQVPLAEMFGYATAIRSLSKGRASYSMEPLTFEQVPTSILNTILDSAKARPAARS